MIERRNERGLERSYRIRNGIITRVGIGKNEESLGNGWGCIETRGKVDRVRGLGRCRGVNVDVIHVGW